MTDAKCSVASYLLSISISSLIGGRKRRDKRLCLSSEWRRKCMSEKVNSPTSFTRTSSRRSGRHMSKAERKQAQETFIEAYRLNGNIMLSCRRTNIDRSTYYVWMEQDEQFSFAVHQAERD